MKPTALVFCENEFGKIDGKVANGLARYSEKYEILCIIDSKCANLDSGEYLDGIKNDIPIYSGIEVAIKNLNLTPDYFIYGVAPLESTLNTTQRSVILFAMEKGMNIVNGLPEFLNDDNEFKQHAIKYNVQILDIRKPPKRNDLHLFTGKINDVKIPVVAVLGTDCAVGKRTTALKLVRVLKDIGINVVFITTGQTGILQGAKYGIAVDVLSSGFATGEVENAILTAIDQENPDILIIEGQGALSHPAFTSTSAIIRGSMPDGIILQHPPKRKNHCDYPDIPMPTVESEIELLELYSKSKVIAVTINHENMSDDELKRTIMEYEYKYKIPVTDVLKHGSNKLIEAIFNLFPILLKDALRV